MEYIIRNAMDTDKVNIYNLKKNNNYDYVKSIWGWDEEYQLQDFEKSFTSANIYVIEDKKEFVGFYQVTSYESILNIEEIHISCDYRKKGIASAIIKSIIKDNPDKKKVIGCFKSNIGARKLYESLGFECVKETNTHYVLEIAYRKI